MAITKFQPEVWAATLLATLAKNLVYAGAPCVNRDYEGDIAEFGDTVHITSIADPSIVDYTKDTDLTVEVLSDAEQILLIDQQKAFAFEVDDIDLRQSRNGGALMSEAANRAAFGLRDKADQFVVGKMLGSASNSLGVVDATTPTNVYEQLLVPAGVKLDQANVPTEGRFMVIDPAAYGKLLLDNRFVRANESGSTAGLRNGIVGEAAGFTIMKSNNAFQANRVIAAAATHTGTLVIDGAPAGSFNQGDIGLSVTGTGVGAAAKVATVSADGTSITTTVNSTASATVAITLAGGGQVAVAGSSIATSFADQISKVEAFRPEKRFADALKGLHLYGSKVVRPSGLVVASVKVA